ncbi:hypothetical protein [Geodermatophilus normandii]|uniref:Uncharacterized protein n=1 Tax=Geodermatophilus normandii TaxID=1137989 RepID=A0A6P0GLE9_9ACTN|nr:hypothetical protein [Geodermatophilus normandii]NEM08054.1 hypothetical protein [Geodermatophilus normandii]
MLELTWDRLLERDAVADADAHLDDLFQGVVCIDRVPAGTLTSLRP